MGKKKNKKNNNKSLNNVKNNNSNNIPKNKKNNKKNTKEKRIVNAKRVVSEINNIIKKATSTPKPIVPEKWKTKEEDTKITVTEVKPIHEKDDVESFIEESTKKDDIVVNDEKDEVIDTEEKTIEENTNEEKENVKSEVVEEKHTIFNDSKLLNKIVIVLVLIIITLIVYIFYASLDPVTKEKKQGVSTKQDVEKDFVFNASYKNKTKAHEIVANNTTYYADNLIVPFINFRTEDADKDNLKIKKIYNDAIKVFNSGIKNKNTYVEDLKYNYYVNSDIVSILITYKYFISNVSYTKYYTFNYNNISGNKISNRDLLDKAHLTNKDFYNSLDVSIYNHLNDANDLSAVENAKLKDKTLDTFKDKKKKKMYMGPNQIISVIVPLYYKDDDYTNTVLEVK